MVHTLINRARDATAAERDDDEASLTYATPAAQEAERLLHLGEPLLAYNAVQRALSDWPRDIRLQQLKGLALARSGALRRANEVLMSLRDEGVADGETLGLLARTHKDLALSASDSGSRERHLAAAYEIYAAGYGESSRRGALADAYYTGINASAMALLRGQVDRAREIAADVERLCQEAFGTEQEGPDAYWLQATFAEAALILGDHDAARKRYSSATALAGNNFGDLSSTRHQARLLLEHQGESAAWLDAVINIPPVLVFTGHMIDAADRSRQRFQPQMENAVRAGILSRLEQIQPLAAYGSAACGVDILCLECVQELGGELHIVLPFPAEQFRARSVDIRAEGKWGERFDRLLQSAHEVLVISERPPRGESCTFEYANLIITGLARLRAQLLDTRMQALAVWDGEPGDGEGGTASLVSMWRSYGVPLEHIELPDGADASSPIGTQTVAEAVESRMADAGEWRFDYEIKAMLFADAVGYSRLREDQVPLFFQHYVGTIAEFNEQTPHKAVHIETAGDGMYMVFDEPETAAHYALGLSERVNSLDWRELGLPEEMGVRIGLHCGPVFIGRDPVTGEPLFSGIHTSRAARIEPITPPGQVYASSAFAAVALSRGTAGFRFSYIGRTQLAKDYGVLPLYHVKRQERPD